MRSSMPQNDVAPEGDPRHHRLVLLTAAVLTLAAATTGGLLLRDPGPAREGSREPAPASAPTTMSSDEAYLRQVCGKDFDPARGKGSCLVRMSLSPSEIAEVVRNLPTGPE